MPSRTLLALILYIGLLSLPAHPLAAKETLYEEAPVALPIDFTHTAGYATYHVSLHIHQETGMLMRDFMPADTPFTIDYAIEDWSIVPMSLPLGLGDEGEGIPEPDLLQDRFYIELWSGVPFTPSAGLVTSWELSGPGSGSVSAQLPGSGRYFIVFFRIPGPLERPVEEVRHFFSLEEHTSDWLALEHLVPNYSGSYLSTGGLPEGASNALFLPGIKASRLYDASGNKLWEPFGNHDVEALMHAPDGSSLHGVFAHQGDIVDRVAGVIDIYTSFVEFMDGLVADGRIEDWRAAAYDWRLPLPAIVQSGIETENGLSFLAPADEPYLVRTLESLAATSPTGKVTIIAHSNGGLVAKALLQELGDAEAARLVDDLILVGVPQAGAPQALAALLYGYAEGVPHQFPGIVSVATARAYAENAPMAYHLLPSAAYFAALDGTQHPVVSFGAGEAYNLEQRAYGTHLEDFEELASFAAALEGGREKPARTRTDQANVLNPQLLAYARDIHQALNAWTPPPGVAVHQIAGWGGHTLAGIRYYERCARSLCASLYRPVFVGDGDGVVPALSALLMPETERGKRYWVDLEAYAFDLFGKKGHGNLLTVDSIQNLMGNILTGEPIAALPENIFSGVPSERAPEKKFTFFLHSPLTLALYDSDGKRTGPTGAGEAELGIPGSAYGRFGEVQYLVVPSGAEYQIALEGYEDGTFTLEMEETEGDETVASAAFVAVPNASTTRAIMKVKGSLKESDALLLDYDGDGNIDRSLPLVIETSADSAMDETRERTRARSSVVAAPESADTLYDLQLRVYLLLLQLLLQYLEADAHMTLATA